MTETSTFGDMSEQEFAELEAATAPQVETTEVSTQEAVSEPDPAPVAAVPEVTVVETVTQVAATPAMAEVIATKVFADDELPASVNEYLDSAGASGKYEVIQLFARLRTYVKAMDPKNPQTVESGSEYQRLLFTALMQLFERVPSTDFRVAMTHVRAVFAMHINTLFKPEAAYRFVNQMTHESSEKDAFCSLVLLMTRICHDDFKVAIKQLNTSKLMSSLSDEARMRMIAYLRG